MTRSNNPHVLLVEDNAQSAGLYLGMLEGHYDVEWVTNLDEGRAKVSASTFEVLVLDLQIPTVRDGADEHVDNGMAVLEAALAADRFQPIVVLTAHDQRDLVRAVLQRTGGCQIVFKDEDNLEQVLLGALGAATGATAWRMAKTVREFRALVESDANENSYRRFISANWRVLLGPEYTSCTSPYEFSRGAEIDLLPIRADGYADLWELKRPNQQVFQSYNSWLHLSSDAARALGQLMEYVRLAEAEPPSSPRGPDRRRGLHVSLNRPRGYIVIGRYSTEPEVAEQQRDWVRMTNSFLAGIQLLTYDDLVERAEALVAFVRDAHPGQ